MGGRRQETGSLICFSNEAGLLDAGPPSVRGPFRIIVLLGTPEGDHVQELAWCEWRRGIGIERERGEGAVGDCGMGKVEMLEGRKRQRARKKQFPDEGSSITMARGPV